MRLDPVRLLWSAAAVVSTIHCKPATLSNVSATTNISRSNFRKHLQDAINIYVADVRFSAIAKDRIYVRRNACLKSQIYTPRKPTAIIAAHRPTNEKLTQAWRQFFPEIYEKLE